MREKACKGIVLLLTILTLVFQHCEKSNSATRSALQDREKKDTSGLAPKVNINAAYETGRISPLLMGFNIVYNNATDAVWRDGRGKVPGLLKKIKTAVLRYPGGTVTTFYHWEHPIGQGGHKDSWAPSYDSSKNSPPASMMDLDEYLSVCRSLRTEPLIGINMGSGIKYQRIRDGIQEAVELMKHCIQKGFQVKYFYLDNEPYQHDANHTYTAEEYADMINQYATAMKQVDTHIKIIANTKPIWKPLTKADLSFTKTLIAGAGKNIDFLDIHNYWAWGHATFDLWKKQENMEVGSTGMTYRDQRIFYKSLALSMGYPNMDMISLEWNIGPPGKNNIPPTQAEAALIIAEQFMQLVHSGMRMATFWPMYWGGRNNTSRALLNEANGYETNKVYDMFALYKDILGREKVKSKSSDSAIEVLSVKSVDEDTLWVYIINKIAGAAVSNIDLHVDGFQSKQYRAIGFKADDPVNGPLKTEKFLLKKMNVEDFSISMPQYSFAKIIFTK